MEFSDVDRTLLALLLTLKSVNISLEEEKQSQLNQQLYRVGQQLKLKPERWNFIKRSLESIITDRPKIQQEFQGFLIQLEMIGNQLSPEVLPTDIELEQELETKPNVERRGFKPGTSGESLSTTLINDLVVPTLLSSNPPEVTKKLSFLERLQQQLEQIDRDEMVSPTNL